MSKVKIIFPAVFTKVTGGEKIVEVNASNLLEAINNLGEKYGPQFRNRVFESPGQVRRLLNFYINGKNIQHMSGFETHLNEGDEVSILPAVSGG